MEGRHVGRRCRRELRAQRRHTQPPDHGVIVMAIEKLEPEGVENDEDDALPGGNPAADFGRDLVKAGQHPPVIPHRRRTTTPDGSSTGSFDYKIPTSCASATALSRWGLILLS